jgi:hypothetical protein
LVTLSFVRQMAAVRLQTALTIAAPTSLFDVATTI